MIDRSRMDDDATFRKPAPSPDLGLPTFLKLNSQAQIDGTGVPPSDGQRHRGIEVKTRIADQDKQGVWKGKRVKKKQKVEEAEVIRAGIKPYPLFYLKLTDILNPTYVRQDHIMSQRIEKKNGVEGSLLLGSEIG